MFKAFVPNGNDLSELNAPSSDICCLDRVLPIEAGLAASKCDGL